MIEFLTVTALITLAIISPGPNFAVVVKNSFISRKAGLFTALGITCGALLHASYCIMGLTVIISKSLLLFNTIKYVGAAYLMYIGIKGLFSKHLCAQQKISAVPHISPNKKRAFWQGFFCNILNPKAILFFIALFTVIITPATPFFMQTIYGFTIAGIDLLWFSGLAILLTHHKMTAWFAKAQLLATRIMGGFLIAFGLRIATMGEHV